MKNRSNFTHVTIPFETDLATVKSHAKAVHTRNHSKAYKQVQDTHALRTIAYTNSPPEASTLLSNRLKAMPSTLRLITSTKHPLRSVLAVLNQEPLLTFPYPPPQLWQGAGTCMREAVCSMKW